MAVPVAYLLSADPFRLAAQSPSTYRVDANWARLPAGTMWNGNTSWITPDGKGPPRMSVSRFSPGRLLMTLGKKAPPATTHRAIEPRKPLEAQRR